MSKELSNKSFEKAMQELDNIVSQMEAGNLPLEKMIDAYKQGALLARHCRDKLLAAQGEIKKLEKNELVPFGDGDNS